MVQGSAHMGVPTRPACHGSNAQDRKRGALFSQGLSVLSRLLTSATASLRGPPHFRRCRALSTAALDPKSRKSWGGQTPVEFIRSRICALRSSAGGGAGSLHHDKHGTLPDRSKGTD